ncbi:amidohydrolase [Lawsonibacter sp. JLR.KK007]|uniref:amidohydrolase n=1 Tax=Lawsonibacter sp. JLR.KK007 TaxID=3114293 RepID=UPI002FEFC29A
MNRNSNNDSMNATEKRELNGSILLYNGNFFRFDGKKNYTWMWIQEGMIRDAGYRDCDAGYLAMAEEAVDLKGSLVLPGFYDCHVHVVPTALDRMKLDLNGSRNFEEMGTRLREWAERYPRQSTVYACRLEISDLEEKCLPNRQVIDQFLRDYDVWIECRDFHCTILNTKALHSINIPWTIEGVEVDEFMRPTGIFRGKANALLRQKIGNSYNIQDKERAVLDLSKQLLKKGVTSIHAMEGGEGFPEQDVKLLLSCIPRLPLDVCIYFGTMELDKVKALGLTRVGDIFLDGSFTAGEAALDTSYHDRSGSGTLYYSQEEVNQFLLNCYQAGLDTSLHAVGSRAVEQALRAHEYARRETGIFNLRHRIEHAELTTKHQRRQAGAMGIIFSMQPAFEYFYGGSRGMFAERLGELWQQTNPFQDIRNAGVRICGGSDSGLTPVNPIGGIHAAVNHPVESSRVTVEEALSMFTRDAAWVGREEGYKGELEIGRVADLAVMDRNIFRTNPKGIITAEVILTMKSGAILYQDL